MRVMKFGGTSLATPKSLTTALTLVHEAAQAEQVVVVTSAVAGVTDLLTELVRGNEPEHHRILDEIGRRYSGLWDSLSTSWGEIMMSVGLAPIPRRPDESHAEELVSFPRRLGACLEEVSNLGETVKSGKPWPGPKADRALALGERLSAYLLASLLRQLGVRAVSVDGTEVIRTDSTFGGAEVDALETHRLIQQRLGTLGPNVLPVVAGFAGSDTHGRPTTLGRGTSDLTASLIGSALNARIVEIWTDVDGIFRSDPARATNLRPIPNLSFTEARDLARSGAKVLHPRTLDPLEPAGIPLVVRNTLRPGVPGSVVSAGGPSRTGVVVSGRNGCHGGSDLPVNLILAGATGGVGTELLRQLASASPSIRRHAGVDLRIAQAFSRSVRVWDPDGLTAEEVLERLEGPGTTQDGQYGLAGQDRLPVNPVFVDCTASQEVSSRYLEFLRAGVPVVTPNKIALSGSYSEYVALQDSARTAPAPFRYETTVGAALPILGTVRKLHLGGDRLRSATAVLSGTLSYVFDRVSRGTSFSEAVAEARRKGFTEPHPREDLGGADVARKLLILLREAGLELEPDALPVESLVPEHGFREDDPERFLKSLEAVDELWRERARAAGESRLTYLAWYDGNKAGVGVQALSPSHPLASLRAGENMVVLTTDRYPEVPLTIAGPGAGREITASGVFTDLLAAIRDAYAGTRAAPFPHPTSPGSGPRGKRRAA